jgi:hypothetical protein
MSDPPCRTTSAAHLPLCTENIAHPTGVKVDIVGIAAGNHGRSCEEHDVCGRVLEENSVVRIRHVQILVDGNEESALAVYWIADGIDCCRVGFLQRHLLKHWKEYNGRLAQIVDMYKDSESPSKRRKNHRNMGCCQAVIIDTQQRESDNTSQPARKRQRTTKEKDGKEEEEKEEEKVEF